MEDYLHDMKITQEYAVWNRKAIADSIIKEMEFNVIEELTTIHNYIDIEEMMLRKEQFQLRLVKSTYTY